MFKYNVALEFNASILAYIPKPCPVPTSGPRSLPALVGGRGVWQLAAGAVGPVRVHRLFQRCGPPCNQAPSKGAGRSVAHWLSLRVTQAAGLPCSCGPEAGGGKTPAPVIPHCHRQLLTEERTSFAGGLSRPIHRPQATCRPSLSRQGAQGRSGQTATPPFITHLAIPPTLQRRQIPLPDRQHYHALTTTTTEIKREKKTTSSAPTDEPMSCQYLQVPSEYRHPLSLLQVPRRYSMKTQEIPSRCMSPHQLNNLLTSIFPCGGYLVDVEHDVYKIRAPRVISKVRIPSFGN